MTDKSLRTSEPECSASDIPPASGPNLPADTLSEESIRSFAVRTHRAKLMLAIIDEIERTWGQHACARHVQHLKWELAQCYLELGAQSEMGFLSIVELIEASLHGETWKQYNPERFNLLRKVLKSTTEKPVITYEDYEVVQDIFWDAEIDTPPGLSPALFHQKGSNDGKEE